MMHIIPPKMSLFRMEFTVIYRNQSEVSKLMDADGRRPGLVRSLPTSSLAEVDTVEKYSAGNEKSHRRMLLVVSSSESSRNGESPLQYLVTCSSNQLSCLASNL